MLLRESEAEVDAVVVPVILGEDVKVTDAVEVSVNDTVVLYVREGLVEAESLPEVVADKDSDVDFVAEFDVLGLVLALVETELV